MRTHLVPYVHKVDRNGTHSQVAEGTRDPSLKWKGKFTGSNPVLTAMSKRCSESLVQDLNNELAECLRREWDIVGTKESDTTPPSSVDFFKW